MLLSCLINVWRTAYSQPFSRWTLIDQVICPAAICVDGFLWPKHYGSADSFDNICHCGHRLGGPLQSPADRASRGMRMRGVITTGVADD